MHIQEGLSLNEMTKKIIDVTWKSERKSGELGLIQQQTEQVFLTYLLASSIDEKASFTARAVLRKSLEDLKIFIEDKMKGTTDELLAGHYALALERMKSPDKAKPTLHAAIPPGAPIGCME